MASSCSNVIARSEATRRSNPAVRRFQRVHAYRISHVSSRGAPLPQLAYRIHTSRIRNAFHGVARRAETRATPRDEGWPRRRDIECPRPALSQCSDFAPLVSIVMKVLSQQRTPSCTNQYGFGHSSIASNGGFKRRLRAHLTPELNLHVLR